MDLVTLFGIIGANLVLVGFIGSRLKYWQADSMSYIALNAFGSLVLVAYSALIDSYPFILLNVVWLIFSVNDVFRRR